MKRLTKQLAAGALSLTLLLSASGCSWGQPEETTTPTTVPVQTQPTTPPAGTDCYTYRDWVDSMPANWNPQEWTQTAEEELISLTNPGLYAIYPGSGDGDYVLRPEMAAEAPVDVTGKYTGSDTYNIPGSAVSGYAYRIDLNPDAKWDDGTPVNADTYLYSLKQMLSSEAKHSRASQFWSGMLCIANAWDYYMQDMAGKATYRTLADLGYASVAEARNDGVNNLYLDMDGFWGLDCGWKSLDDGTMIRDVAVPSGMHEDTVSASYLYRKYLADGTLYSAYQTSYIGVRQSRIQELSFESVGLLKTGEYQITLVLDRPMSAEELQWNLTTGWLVQEEYYGEDYGTSVETSPSCGPYRLVELGETSYRLERNESWYGYTDGKHRRQYQATAVEYTYYETEAQALEAFDQELLDTVDVSRFQEDSMAQPSTVVTKLTFNSSLTTLNLREREGVDKSILSNSAFRRAISLAIDRQDLVDSLVPTAEATLGLLGSSFFSDLSAGTGYRASEAGQQVLEKLYGSKDASGYDAAMAASLFQEAYDETLATGRIQETDMVELELLVYSQDEFYDRMVGYLQDALSLATVGTSLENRIRLVKTVDPDYYTAAREGRFDLILSAWSGSVTDPYSIMGCYCDEDRKFEFGFEPSVESCTIQVGDKTVTRTYRGWYEALVNGKYASGDLQTRNQVLAGLEYALLSEYDAVPLYQRSQVFVDSGRIARDLENPLPLIGFGGVRYAVFTLDDYEWELETGVAIS